LPTLTNCIFWANSDAGGMDESAQIFVSGSPPIVTFSCIQDNDPNDANIPFGGTANGNIDDDPAFRNPSAGNFRLAGSSPCIDAADSTPPTLPDAEDVDQDFNVAELTPDLDKRTRAVDEVAIPNTGAGTPDFLDMGAFETQQLSRFVEAAAQPGGDGKSWATAYQFLQDALSDAAADPTIAEIRVAGGEYQPDAGAGQTPGDRSATFQLVSAVVVRGGFGGLGASPADPDARNLITFETTLSGDLANDDIGSVLELSSIASRADNTYHVVTGNGSDATAILDGFTIRGGNADADPGLPDGWGGGMLNFAANVTTSPTVLNCKFTDNRAFIGGGMMNQVGDPRVINCRFLGNAAVNFAGGLCNDHGGSQEIVNCLFKGNLSSGGGAVVNAGNSPKLINCTISGNTATGPLGRGGGIWNVEGAVVTITNCIVWGNADDQGPVLPAQIDFPGTVGATLNVTFSCIQDDASGDGNIPFGGASNNNIDLDPQFADADLRVLSGSPCIDAGNDAAVPPDSNDVDGDGDVIERTPDLDGKERVIDGDAMGLAVVDIGAYEFDCLPPSVIAANSIKLHGSDTGPGVEPLNSGPSGAPWRGIASGQSECRVIGGEVELEFVFDEQAYSDDGNSFVASDFIVENGTVTLVTVAIDRKKVTIRCNGVADGQCIDVSFVAQDVYANSIGLQFDWPILLGDANGDGVVDAVDQSVIAAEDTETVTSENFRCDLDQNGLVESNAQGSHLDLDFVTVTDPLTSANCGN
jgi:hypothetical protein